MTRQHFDINNEFIIQRFSQGIKLIQPKKCHNLINHVSVHDMLNMPFHVYFMDAESIIKRMSERAAISFNFISPEDVTGKCVREFAQKESAEHSISNDRAVMNSNKLIIKDESYTRLDDICFKTLVSNFPV